MKLFSSSIQEFMRISQFFFYLAKLAGLLAVTNLKFIIHSGQESPMENK